MPFAKSVVAVLLLSGGMTVFSQAASRPELLFHPHGNFSNNVARPLRYWPVSGDFVITNGPEFFNRPLYCLNSGFRIDGGDKPEFSLYLPGHGGNLRLGIKTATAVKWFNNADQVVTRYRPGSLRYEIRDPALDDAEVNVIVIPLSETKGVVVRAELQAGHSASLRSVTLIFAFGGADGLRGSRGGDIGCERLPVSQLFQLQPASCRDDVISVMQNAFELRFKENTIAGVASPDTKLSLADANEWSAPASLLASAGTNAALAVVLGETPMPPAQPVYMALQLSSDEKSAAPADLPELFASAERHRQEISQQVTVDTPDPFINAAVPALCVAADAVWDAKQQCFMHGAVAWRVRLLGWRGQYAGDDLGWHDRTAAHFASFAAHQNTNSIPDAIPPADEKFNLARHEAAIHSNGDLSHNHYDMNLVAVDAFFRHLLWTGDNNYARAMWPVIERHFAWEHRLFRREFGPDKLPLYEAYAAIWASDDLSYNGAGTAHASAYNYFANCMAARVAARLGKDPAPYQQEADLILRAMNQYLWLTNEGNFAECKDLLGLQLVHPNSGLWTFYHTIDSGVANPLQSWRMSHWIDTQIAHIPITGPNVPNEGLYTLPETGWMPYQWSLNNVVMAEAAHTSLALWEANRPNDAWRLFKGELLDSMYLGLCPGNLGCMTSHDMARGEAQRDFADAIGINSRALVEGLFGVKPDVLAGVLRIQPGFPEHWGFARMAHPDFDFGFHRHGSQDDYSVTARFPKPMRLDLQIRAFADAPKISMNGEPCDWKWMDDLYGARRIEIQAPAAERFNISVEWKGAPPLPQVTPEAKVVASKRPPVFDWKQKLNRNERFETVDLTRYFNDRVTQIFRNDYRSPRSPFASLAMPRHGIGGWCEPKASFEVNDSGLREVAAKNHGQIILPDGIPLATPAASGTKNIVFTSQWDNYPAEVSVPLSGKSSHAFLLMAGSTSALQSRLDSGEVVVAYSDGSTTKLELRNPENWWPIDQDYFTDDFAFRRDGAIPPRIDLATGEERILAPLSFKGTGGKVPGGAATVLDLPLDKGRTLKSLKVRALANEVVIGLMSVTLER